MRKEVQKRLIERINLLCKEKGLSYKVTIPMTTLLHIMEGTTQNPEIV